jgi:hypothetical protein
MEMLPVMKKGDHSLIRSAQNAQTPALGPGFVLLQRPRALGV